MKHYGDITKISGYDVPTTDVLVGGSPCQDLSVAGKRAGLAGERSGLFMEQIRITKEMRANDKSTGRTGESVRPRYLVWENVPGALSSGTPKGADFQAVLEEVIKVVQPEAPSVPIPDKGWPNAGAFFGVGEDGHPFSVAYRIHDAQFWGVPQRRRRIALVADFGGLTASEILFEREGVCGDPDPCEEAWQGTAGAAGEGVEGAGVKILNPSDSQGNQIADSEGAYPTLRGCGGAGYQQGYCLDKGAISFQERAGKPGGGKGILIQHEHTGALSTLNNQSVLTYGISSYASNAMLSDNPHSGIYEADTARTLDLNGGNPACNQGGIAIVQEPILLESNQNHATIQTDGISTALPASAGMGGGYVPMIVGYDMYNQAETGEVAMTLTSIRSDSDHVPCVIQTGCDVYNQEITGDVAASLTAASGGTNTSGPKVLSCGFKPRQGAAARSLGYEHEKSPTINTDENYAVLCLNDQGGSVMGVSEDVTGALRAEEHGHQPLVHAVTIDEKMGQTYVNEELGNTLAQRDYKQPQAVLCYDARGNGDGEVSPTLTGDHQNRVTDYTALCMDVGWLNTEKDTAPSLLARQYKDPPITETGIVRRLTPLECERLQGFPDGWTDLGEWTDSEGKKHKDADSPRYKALGNSIALPFWQWMAKRMAEYLPEGATMCSLFDGIGGFPLVFGRAGIRPVWASEIEEFPIAVTKARFGDD